MKFNKQLSSPWTEENDFLCSGQLNLFTVVYTASLLSPFKVYGGIGFQHMEATELTYSRTRRRV